MCGKNVFYGISYGAPPGSPPHVREELPFELRTEQRFGITPACAGRIRGAFLLLPFFKDHPRMCGKNRTHIVVRGRRQGSPPHVREESLPNRRRHRRMGITPACAGRIHRSVCFIDLTADHPRACGKNYAIFKLAFTSGGSPPRMREEWLSSLLQHEAERITPAHAGRIAMREADDSTA